MNSISKNKTKVTGVNVKNITGDLAAKKENWVKRWQDINFGKESAKHVLNYIEDNLRGEKYCVVIGFCAGSGVLETAIAKYLTVKHKVFVLSTDWIPAQP